MAASARRVGFRAVPFSRYVERLAYAAGIDLGPVLRLFGIPGSGRTAALDLPGDGVVRLAAHLGVSLRELCAHIRIAALLRADLPVVQLARMKSRTARREGALAATEESLAVLEKRGGLAFVRKARECEREVSRLYAKCRALA